MSLLALDATVLSATTIVAAILLYLVARLLFHSKSRSIVFAICTACLLFLATFTRLLAFSGGDNFLLASDVFLLAVTISGAFLVNLMEKNIVSGDLTSKKTNRVRNG